MSIRAQSSHQLMHFSKEHSTPHQVPPRTNFDRVCEHLPSNTCCLVQYPNCKLLCRITTGPSHNPGGDSWFAIHASSALAFA